MSELKSEADFAQFRLQKLWIALLDMSDRGWEFAVEESGRGTMLNVFLEATQEVKSIETPDFGRIVRAICLRDMSTNLVCHAHNGGTGWAAKCLFIFDLG